MTNTWVAPVVLFRGRLEVFEGDEEAVVSVGHLGAPAGREVPGVVAGPPHAALQEGDQLVLGHVALLPEQAICKSGVRNTVPTNRCRR